MARQVIVTPMRGVVVGLLPVQTDQQEVATLFIDKRKQSGVGRHTSARLTLENLVDLIEQGTALLNALQAEEGKPCSE